MEPAWAIISSVAAEDVTILTHLADLHYNCHHASERVKYEPAMSRIEIQLNVGQRVRVEGGEDPFLHVGKMGIVERIEVSTGGEKVCIVRIDRLPELVTIP